MYVPVEGSEVANDDDHHQNKNDNNNDETTDGTAHRLFLAEQAPRASLRAAARMGT